MGDWFKAVKPSNNSKKADILIQYPLDREFQDRYDMQLVVMDNGGVSGTYVGVIQQSIFTVTQYCINNPLVAEYLSMCACQPCY